MRRLRIPRHATAPSSAAATEKPANIPHLAPSPKLSRTWRPKNGASANPAAAVLLKTPMYAPRTSSGASPAITGRRDEVGHHRLVGDGAARRAEDGHSGHQPEPEQDVLTDEQEERDVQHLPAPADHRAQRSVDLAAPDEAEETGEERHPRQRNDRLSVS